jgi:hypothetical protein
MGSIWAAKGEGGGRGGEKPNVLFSKMRIKLTFLSISLGRAIPKKYCQCSANFKKNTADERGTHPSDGRGPGGHGPHAQQLPDAVAVLEVVRPGAHGALPVGDQRPEQLAGGGRWAGSGVKCRGGQ